MTTKEYLGDSVYVRLARAAPDCIIVTTENGVSPSSEIFLEPQVLQQIVDYARKHGIKIK